MAGDFLSQVLGSVLGGAQRDDSGGAGAGGLGGGLGGILGSVLGGNPSTGADASAAGGGRAALLAMLLPLALQWVQRSGGVGGVLDQFRQRGLGQQAGSWVSNAPNEPVSPQAMKEVVGAAELSQLAQQLGVSHEEVAGGLAQIIPQVVNHLTPEGHVPHDADQTLDSAIADIGQVLNRFG
jgi:uncharacterized protein YidB (DUF937 family)